MDVVAVLGLGEAGTRYAADLLAAGIEVAGYDPVTRPELPGLRQAEGPADAVRGAGIVLSLNSSRAAERAARAAAAGLRDGAVFADLNASSPEGKRRVAAVIAGTGALFADVAVLAPVPRRGLLTPLAISGTGRGRLAAFLTSLGVPVEDAGAEPGAAAGRKLLRSVLMKGFAAVVLESLEAAAAAGQEAWLRNQIVAELTAADGAMVDRFVDGTWQHAARRLEEMRAAGAYLAELGVRGDIAAATVARLERMAAAAPPGREERHEEQHEERYKERYKERERDGERCEERDRERDERQPQ